MENIEGVSNLTDWQPDALIKKSHHLGVTQRLDFNYLNSSKATVVVLLRHFPTRVLLLTPSFAFI